MPVPSSPARKALQNRANLFVFLALLLSIGGYALAVAMRNPTIYRALAIIGLPLWVLGCMAYAESKGHSKWLGFLGVLTCCGLLVLVLLPNRWTDAPEGPMGGDYPRNRA